MRTWWIAVLFAIGCGDVAENLPDAPLTCAAAGSACTTNPSAPCVTGVYSCENDVLVCTDSDPAVDGTTCGAGMCTRGTCVSPVSVTSTVDLSTTPLTFGRTCAESPVYSITALPTAMTATLSSAPDAGCLAAGDEVLVINLQGSPAAIANVGAYEVLLVASVADTTVTFTAAKTKNYGAAIGSDAGIGVGATDQKVALVRIAEFGELAIGAAGTITMARWNGRVGGVVAFRAASVAVDGTISAAGLGYRNGRWSIDAGCSTSLTTETGESITGPATASTANNLGGPGGIGGASGIPFNGTTPINSGAGHATAGEMGSAGNGRTIGSPGAVYGTSDASTLTFGSGASGNVSCDGASPLHLAASTSMLAGGIVFVLAHQLSVGATGTITVNANAAARSVSASAGYILLRGDTLSLGTDRVTAIGGVVTQGSRTVRSGNGYIVVDGTTVTGTATPTATQL